MGKLRLILRTLASVLILLVILLPNTITWLLGAHRVNRRFLQLVYTVSCFVWGIRVNVQGAISKHRPLLIVSNHFSYTDIFALGKVLPASFVAKKDIESWPIAGFFAKIGGCIFVERKPSQTLKYKKVIEDAAARGDVIVLFPEGSTDDGTALMPFRSSFFSIVEGTQIPVQPVSIVYTHIDDRAVTRADLPIIGWYGDAYLLPHVTKFLQLRHIDVSLIFHPPINVSDFESRKTLAAYCQEVIAKPLAAQHNA